MAVIYCVKCDMHIDLDDDVGHVEAHEMNQVTVTRIKTKNDINGNPRRAWIIHSIDPGTTVTQVSRYSYASCIGVVEEGYSGKDALVAWLVCYHCKSIELDDIKVSPNEYNRFIGKAWTLGCINERYRILGG